MRPVHAFGAPEPSEDHEDKGHVRAREKGSTERTHEETSFVKASRTERAARPSLARATEFGVTLARRMRGRASGAPVSSGSRFGSGFGRGEVRP